MTDIRDKLDKIDEEILRLLGDRVALCIEAQEEDPEMFGPEYQADVLAQWDTAADEHGWNAVQAARVGKGVLDLCKPLD